MKTVYCDLDGVIVDFDKGANFHLRQFNTNLDQTEKDDTTWDFLNLIPNFWETLEFKRDGLRLWSVIKKLDYRILSAYSKTNSEISKQGKYTWLSRNLPEIPRNRIILCMRSEKKAYALDKDGYPNILIDDKARNISEWKQAGGWGILHTTADQSIKELLSLLNKYGNTK